MFAIFFIVAICMIQGTEHFISRENWNLMHDEEFRHLCKQSFFQRGDFYKSVGIHKAKRNEFIFVQVAKVNTDCNFKLIAYSMSEEKLTVHNIFPTDHLNQNIIILVACSKLLRQANYFRVWYHNGGVLRTKPHDDLEGLKYVAITPESKCKFRKGKTELKNQSTAFVHFLMARIRLPVSNITEEIWRKIGNATDMQQPRFQSFESLSKYQKSIYVPDSFMAKHSPVVTTPHNLTLLTAILFIFTSSFLF